MKSGIHPKYVECQVTCGCGNSFVTRATTPTLSVEICSQCHPFYTGKQKYADVAGRVERFKQRHAWDESKKDELSQKKKARRGKRERVTIGVPTFKGKKEDAEEEEKKDAGKKGDAKKGDAKKGDAPAAKGDAPAADKGDAPAKEAKSEATASE